jgi:hypothetical protein
MVLPLGAYAEGLDKGLENAIKIVKDKFSIPDGYKFDSSIDASSYNNETIKVFRLSWVNEDVESFNASVDEKGTILNYSHYRYSDGAQQTKLPKYSLSEAKSLADKFLVKVIPDMAGIRLSQSILKYLEMCLRYIYFDLAIFKIHHIPSNFLLS